MSKSDAVIELRGVWKVFGAAAEAGLAAARAGMAKAEVLRVHNAVVGIADAETPRLVDHHQAVVGHRHRVAGQCDERRRRRRQPVDDGIDLGRMRFELVVNRHAVEHVAAGAVDPDGDVGRRDIGELRREILRGHAPETDLVIEQNFRGVGRGLDLDLALAARLFERELALAVKLF